MLIPGDKQTKLLAAARASFSDSGFGTRPIRSVFAHSLLPWLVLVACLVLTIVLWRSSAAELATSQNERFARTAESYRNILIARMRDYEQVLRGGVALFNAHGMPSRAQWRTYVESLELDRSLPGIGGTGFAVMLERRHKAAHEASVQAEGYLEYHIHPDTRGDALSSILYLEPFTGRNQRAFGYDMFSEPVRREAMARARDTGQPALSGKVTLVQETSSEVQAGFLMYLPVYRAGWPHDTVEARRLALVGFVYSPFRAGDLLREVFENARRDVEIQLFDGAPTADNLLFSSFADGRQARHATDLPFTVAGRPWTARFSSSPAYESRTSSLQPTMILVGGLLLSFLLFAVLYLNARFSRQMRATTLQLEQSLGSYLTLVKNIPGAVFRREADSLSLVEVSEGIEALTAEPPERFLSGGLSYDDLIADEDQAKVRRIIQDALAKQVRYEVEYRIQGTNDFTRWVIERGRGSSDATGQTRWVDGVILDITDRKAAENIIRERAFKDTLTGLPNRRLLLDRLHHQLATSERTRQYGALLFIDLDDFKAINDTHGHQAGDKVLVEVARRLRATIRESDTVARQGGDEFVVVLDNLGLDRDEAAHGAWELAGKLRDELSVPYTLESGVYTTTPSIGVTLLFGQTIGAHQLLRRADLAMYQAKAAGRNQLTFYERDVPKAAGGGQ